MKKVDKNVYHEARYGRKALKIVAIVLLVLALALLVSGIVLLMIGSNSKDLGQIIVNIIFGVSMILIGLIGCGFSLPMLFVALSMLKNNNGNVKDGNRAMGTINVLKCDKCGREMNENSTFCTNCGTPVDGYSKCECGAVNSNDAKFCGGCGKNLEK